MKRIFATYSVLLAGLIAGGPADAQPASSPTGQKTLAATVGLYAFPADGQSPEKQNREEAECYSWAVNNTKTDPFNLAKRLRQTEAAAEHEKEHIAESGKGAGAKGALGGAAVGALIGEIASDDAGGGAALGAAAGLIAGRRNTINEVFCNFVV